MDRGLFRRNVLIGLHALGLGLAVYLTWAYYLNYYLVEGNILLCTLGKVFDCYAVLMSRWAELVPGWPVSSVAVFYFTLQLLWTATEGPGLVRGRHDVPFVLNAAACLVGMVLFCAMIFSVKSLCIFCLSIDATLWSTLLLRWRWRSQENARRPCAGPPSAGDPSC